MILLNNVSKTVTSGSEKLTILHAVYLTIPRGQFVAVVGPSGSGKSTLLSLVAGLDYPTTGDIRLDGEYITQMKEDELARLRGAKVGFIFQSFHLIPSLTAYENILVPMEIAGLPKARERAQALLEEVGLRERGHHYPSQLSGGEQQRVAIARAFSNSPTILLADEPTGNLDSKNGAHIFELLVKLNREHDTTLLLVTHDHRLANQADRVISLSEGRVVEDREKGRRGEGEIGRQGSRETRGRTSLSPTPYSPPPLPSQRGVDMNFVLNMAWREMRASWRRLLLFFLCIAIGVGSIVSLRSLVQKMRAAIGREARVMYACDVQVGSNQSWKPEIRAVVERYLSSPLVEAHTEVMGIQTMVRPVNDSNARPVMVILQGVQEQYPLYGEIQLAGGARYTHSMLKGRGILLPSGVMTQLNLKVGDEVRMGRLTFTVRGAIENMPGYGINLRPLPRVVVDYADAAGAGLTGFGSFVWYVRLFKAREGQDQALLEGLERDLKPERSYWLGSFRGMQNFANRILERMEAQLSFAGLVILVLGAIGISSVTRVFVQQKMKTIAILKCLGGDNRHVLGAYLAQAIALCVVGSLLGLMFAGALTLIIPRLFDGVLPFQFEVGLTWRAALQGVGIGMLVTLLFSLPPLLEIRRVKPMLVMRQNTVGDERRIDWLSLGAALLIVLVLLALTSYQASSLRIGGIFIGMLVGTALVLNLIGAGLMRLLRRARRLPSFVLRQGVGSLYRPGNQTQVILMAVGLGTLFVTAMRLQQANLMRELNVDLSMAALDMYLLDIQKDQRPGAEATITRLTGAAPEIIPMVRTRLVEIKRAPDNSQSPQTVDPDMLGREQWVTYKPDLAREDETVVAGKLWEPAPNAEPEVSMRDDAARDYKLAVGDSMIFDFAGRRMEAKVTSIRRIKWDFSPSSGYFRFGIIFRPGALEDAPQTFVGAIKGPAPGAQRAQLQRELVEQFPNVSVLDVYDQAAFVRTKINDASLAVNFLGAFVFLCGVLILTGSVAMTKIHRLYEAAILKTLGAEKKLIVYITLIEYGVLGLLAGVTGSSAAIALTWLISKYGIKNPWQLIPSINLIGVAAALLLVMTVGVLSSWDVMTKKPLGILRAE